jgi:hypothetical protein
MRRARAKIANDPRGIEQSLSIAESSVARAKLLFAQPIPLPGASGEDLTERR